MLNLQQITKTKKLYEIIMPDGVKLTLKMPTQAMFNHLISIQNINTSDAISAMQEVYGIVTEILNLNTQGRVYEREDVGAMLDLATCVLVIQDYLQNTTAILGE